METPPRLRSVQHLGRHRRTNYPEQWYPNPHSATRSTQHRTWVSTLPDNTEWECNVDSPAQLARPFYGTDEELLKDPRDPEAFGQVNKPVNTMYSNNTVVRGYDGKVIYPHRMIYPRTNRITREVREYGGIVPSPNMWGWMQDDTPPVESKKLQEDDYLQGGYRAMGNFGVNATHTTWTQLNPQWSSVYSKV